MGGYTGVCSFCTPLDVHDLKAPLITDHNSLRTQPRYSGTRSGVRCITIQVQCTSFIEDGHPSDYWRPEDYRTQVLITWKSDSVYPLYTE